MAAKEYLISKGKCELKGSTGQYVVTPAEMDEYAQMAWDAAREIGSQAYEYKSIENWRETQ